MSAYAHAGLTANPDEPKLATFGSGQALATLRQGLTDYRNRGQIVKGKIGTSPHVADSSPASDPTVITISDCMNTSDFLVYNAKSGALINDTPGGRRAVAAFAGEVDGTWKVTDLGFHEVGSC